MQPTLGVLRTAPEDGVLRGRVGAKRWVCQLCIQLLLGFILLVIVIVAFAEVNLVLILVFLILGCLVIAALRTWFYPLAWLGMDQTPPVVFDLGSEKLEVLNLRHPRRLLALTLLQDVRVYRAEAEFSADTDVCYANARPLHEAQVRSLDSELPRMGDVVRECGRSLLLCCLASRPPPGVSCALLAAKIKTSRGEEEIIQLSRCAWHLRDVESLCELAREVRSRVGLQETLPEVPSERAPEPRREPKQDAPGPTAAVMGATDREPIREPQRAAGAHRNSSGVVSPVAADSPVDATEDWMTV
uniref:Uncharacterized protein n=1 Tax=Alexandrium monilatum TaxID=311494 RepID=A0A7S4V4F4_9DINO|mmetsp:Transcript_2223/g.7040  ORF Transcript_2223/g.7040 Transcript_2223/m.7040 type:complete len:301 (+) Transcript_2223:47-949(+)|eukprot:CAMPEP_0175238048 /NCGR_PEP_ID=MMETSP0093-20121207/28835_1 /TAXON_ID=311494 /ORGANISM="Alexandrium monilatum, Strain CCMP3105" /LENGTH=300 /DNA_ID=CAMNT_0016532047 /DNA_START=45 /DNA_END=947 /DNA_ORIENTATION=+